MDLLQGTNGGSSANSASRGRGGGGRGGHRGCGRGQNDGGRGRGNNNSNNGKTKVKFHVCKKEGHSTVECWYRFDEDFVIPEEKSANAVGKNYGMDTNWYIDSGSTDHITGELDKMMVRDRYNEGEQIHTTNSAGMNIEHIGHVICHTPERNLILDNVLHVQSAKKNLIFVHCLASNNNAFLEFHPNFFLIKDRVMKKTLLEETCRRGLYPLPAAALAH